MSGERGSVAVMTVAAVALAGVLLVGVARVGAAAVLRARADTAADAAALAAADALALGKGPDAAERDAAATARSNGARLVVCACDGTAADVLVIVDAPHALHFTSAITGRARAEVDFGAVFAVNGT
jgi:secretion/DNA translocation related TadE-like protein